MRLNINTKFLLKSVSLITSILLFHTQSVNAQTNTINAADKAALNIENCHVEGIKRQVLCGTFLTPENYRQPEKAQMSLNFVILPAIDNSENNTPVMFLAGGPGQAATELTQIVRATHFETLKTRDIILIDQRGTGNSAELTCDDDMNALNVYAVSSDDLNEKYIKKCISQLQGDLSQFNSENAIRDFDAIRNALGHEKVSLYGGSYGTRAALVYLQK